jgi:hypothetical protein
MLMLEKEFDYYLAHQAELVKKYKGRFLVIRGAQVVGDYATRVEASKKSSSKYAPGTFLIQECQPGKNSYTYTFHSRVAF